MIDDQHKSSVRLATEQQLAENESELEPSKSQRKRDADAIRDIGEHLTRLGASELATIELPDDIISTIEEYSRIKAHGARKRQLGLLAKRLRQIDIEPINAALEKIRLSARANTLNLHLIESWRDRLLGLDNNESPRDALTAFINVCPQADRQKLRQLQARALKERAANNPPAAARELFKIIRDLLA